jgi:hypothetical protein
MPTWPQDGLQVLYGTDGQSLQDALNRIRSHPQLGQLLHHLHFMQDYPHLSPDQLLPRFSSERAFFLTLAMQVDSNRI